MTDSQLEQPDRPGGIGVRWIPLVAVAACAMALVFFWMRGCRRDVVDPDDPSDQEKAKQAKLLREKPPFERLTCLGVEPNVGKRDTPFRCKPGHWSALSLSTKANHQDFDGRLEITPLGKDRAAFRLSSERFTLSTSRPAVLPKGQERTFESFVFIPSATRSGMLDGRVRHRVLSHDATGESVPIRICASHQYHCAVLARYPSRYAFLRDLPAMGSPTDLKMNDETQRFYQVALLDGEKPSHLPSQSLYWTSIACMFWDSADPQQLSLEQQVALVDWLHWGGLLIVSGPDSLDGLRGSFLEPYLPAASIGERKLTREDLAPLSDYWGRVSGSGRSRSGAPTSGGEVVPLVPLQPWPGIAWKILPEAREIPFTGGLLAERRVGRGRVVASRFPLTGRDLVTWPRIDGFVNGCLLRRPPRVFSFDSKNAVLKSQWADSVSGACDPKIISGLRYITRDATTVDAAKRSRREDESDMLAGLRSPENTDSERLDGSQEPLLPDGAGWNDFNAVADPVREALNGAARIQVPSARFVLWAMAVYLIVLVPANWAFFRMLRRVEWAWVAAPVIALVATVVVVRMTQLDIGFARSQTEIYVVETHGGYGRAHVTRYTALYASLYTRYRVAFEDAGAQVQPFAGSVRRATRLGMPLELHYSSGTELRGFEVDSNSTDFLHSEQMLDLGGPLKLTRTSDGTYQLANRSDLTIRDAVVLHRIDSKQTRLARLGGIAAGATVFVRFEPASPSASLSPIASPAAGESARLLDVRRLLAEVATPSRCEPGEFRLVGSFDQEIAGRQITPAAPQIRRAGVLVAHLGFDFGADPQIDENAPIMVDGTFGRPQGDATRRLREPEIGRDLRRVAAMFDKTPRESTQP